MAASDRPKVSKKALWRREATSILRSFTYLKLDSYMFGHIPQNTFAILALRVKGGCRMPDRHRQAPQPRSRGLKDLPYSPPHRVSPATKQKLATCRQQLQT